MTLFKCVWTKWMVKMGLMSQRRVKVLKITASMPNLLQVYDPSYHYSSHSSVKVLQFTSLHTAKKAASMSDANRERKQEMTKKSGLNSAEEYTQGFSSRFSTSCLPFSPTSCGPRRPEGPHSTGTRSTFRRWCSASFYWAERKNKWGGRS